MRLFGLVLIFTIFSSSMAIFRSSRVGMTSIDAKSGDVIWVPIPRDQSRSENVRRCLFCRGRMKK